MTFDLEATSWPDLPSDILADTPQYMTNVAATGGNANAHRAIVRGSFIGLAYDLTPNMDAANPEKTASPAANYNLFFTRSTASGDPGSWSSPVSLSRIDSPAMTVVEPRLVPTPGTIVNPLTGAPDAGDAQNANVVYVAYATETNTLAAEAGRVYVSRSTDRGASFEPFMPVSTTPAGQSESQLRPAPDGSSALVLWMGEQSAGDPDTKDAMYAIATSIELPDLKLTAASASFPAFSHFTANLTVLNRSAGDANKVLLTASLPDGLIPVGVGDPSACTISASQVSCAISRIAAGQSRVFSLTMTSATERSYIVNANVESEEPDTDLADNTLALAVSVTPPLSSLPPLPTPPTPPTPTPTTPPLMPQASDGGGGCSTAQADAPFDPLLLLLAGFGVIGAARRRPQRSRAQGLPASRCRQAVANPS